MHAIRMSEVVNSHDVVIPFELLKPFNHQKIDILVFSTNQPSDNLSKNNLLNVLNHYAHVKPFEKVEDAKDWQRNIRNEW